MIGAVLELMWVLDMPVGTFVPADATMGAVSATAIAALGGAGKPPLDLVGFSILLTTVMVPITMMVDRVRPEAQFPACGEAASGLAGKMPAAGWHGTHLSGLVRVFFEIFCSISCFYSGRSGRGRAF